MKADMQNTTEIQVSRNMTIVLHTPNCIDFPEPSLVLASMFYHFEPILTTIFQLGLYAKIS
jgi:hypothetical protein